MSGALATRPFATWRPDCASAHKTVTWQWVLRVHIVSGLDVPPWLFRAIVVTGHREHPVMPWVRNGVGATRQHPRRKSLFGKRRKTPGDAGKRRKTPESAGKRRASTWAGKKRHLVCIPFCLPHAAGLCGRPNRRMACRRVHRWGSGCDSIKSASQPLSRIGYRRPLREGSVQLLGKWICWTGSAASPGGRHPLAVPFCRCHS